MSFADDMKQVKDDLLQLTGPEPDGFEITPNQLTIRTRTWAGGRVGADGGYSDSDLVIPKKYRIEHVSAKEVASSGGRYEIDDLKIENLTPPFNSLAGSGGFAPEQLKPPGRPGTEIIYVLTGPSAGEYQLVELHTEHWLNVRMVLRRTRRTP